MFPVLEGQARRRLALRLAAWAGIAIVWTLVHSWRRWVFDPGEIRLTFPPKLTFLGLVITLGTFQYRLFVEIAEKMLASFNNPAWQDYANKMEEIRKAHAGTVTADTMAKLEAPLNRWQVYVRATREHARRSFIP